MTTDSTSYVDARLARDLEVRGYYGRFMKVLEAPPARIDVLEDIYSLPPSDLRLSRESPDSSESIKQLVSRGKNVLEDSCSG